jgi:predicted DNA repair protein MutK
MGSYAPQAAMGVAGGVIAIIVMTIGGAVVGFIYGAIIAFIYNIAAGWFGGIEIELE